MRWMHTVLIVIVVTVITPIVFSGVDTEQFLDFSGYDPDLSTAKWNVHDHRMEIHTIPNNFPCHSFKLLDDGNGGFYDIRFDLVNGSFNLYLQQYNVDGYPVFRCPGNFLVENVPELMVDGTVLTNGNILLCWSEDNFNRVLVQIFTPSGVPVLTDPVQVNHTPLGSEVWNISLASMPGNEAVLAFTDDRVGSHRAFVQRILSSGAPVWSSDRQIQNMIFTEESSIVVSTDSCGSIFTAWQQSAGPDTDVAFTRVNLDGSTAWDPALIANLDVNYSQSNMNMFVLEGDGVYFSWHEYTGTQYRMETQRWNFDGTCDNSDDVQMISHSNNLGHGSIQPLSTGNILMVFSLTQDNLNLLGTAVMTPYFTVVSPPSTLLNPTKIWSTDLVRTGVSSLGGAMIQWSSMGGYTFENRMMKVGNLGQPLWPSFRKIERLPGIPFRQFALFTKNSGNNGGFKSSWVDNRSDLTHSFGCGYTSPVQASHFAHQYDLGYMTLASTTAQAPDGTIIALTAERVEDGLDFNLMWTDPQFVPLWKQAVTITEVSLDNSLSSFDIDIDSQGHAIICWTLNGTGSDPGVFYQAVTSQRELVHATPVRVDSGILAGSFRRSVIRPVGIGDAIVCWVDDTSGDQHVYAQRIDSSGTHDWPSQLQITTLPPNHVYDNNLVALSDRMVAVYSIYDGSNATIHRGQFSFDGANILTPQSVSNGYASINGCSADNIGDDVYIVWNAIVCGYNSIFGQKLVNGSPDWIDKPLSNADYDYVNSLDLEATDTNHLVYTISASDSYSRDTLIQEFNTNGISTYPSEQRMILPEPAIYTSQQGVSAQLNTGEQVHWAMILETEDDPRDGSIYYKLSNDGGLTWHPAVLECPVVFPTEGDDLRYSVDLVAEPYLQVSPYVTSITTMWNESQIGSDIVLNHDHFYTGDIFRLSLRHSNTATSKVVDKYILLDVYGDYWFWPSWSENLDFSQDSITSGFTEDIIFDFLWPPDTGVATDLRFWVALLEPDTSILVGPWDYVTFGYGP